jgi:hypothetical protein
MRVNYRWDGMHPVVRISDDDLMPDTQAGVYVICRKCGLTHLPWLQPLEAFCAPFVACVRWA